MRFDLAAVCLIWCSAVASACDCAPPPPVPKALESAAAVFLGETLTIDDNAGPSRLVTLKVEKSWKGIDSQKITVATSRSGASCGYPFQVGGRYLVYANMFPKDSRLNVSLCSRTRTFQEAETSGDLKELGEGKAPKDAPQGKSSDISCDASGSYTGNAINPVFTLKIDNAAKGTWTYTISDDKFGFQKAEKSEYRGTYAIEGDLAIFTGELVNAPAGQKEPSIRFGLNFGFPQKQVAFNSFFPDSKGRFIFHRKWFKRQGAEWVPAEERKLALSPLPQADEKEWKVVLKGQRIRWDGEGKRSEETIDITRTYVKNRTDWYRLDPSESWLPGDLILSRDRDGKVGMIRESNPYIGDLRGFAPMYAALPATP